MKLSFSLFILASMMRSANGAFDCDRCNSDPSLGGVTPPTDTEAFKSWVDSYLQNSSDKQDFRCWDVSEITKLYQTFRGYKDFLPGDESDLSCWDVSKVSDMRYMFYRSNFNGDISAWDVSSVTRMDAMFRDSNFNGDVSAWDVSKVSEMRHMFQDSNFNGDISAWDVSSVTFMNTMFYNSNFNGDISAWDVSKVSDMSSMFYNSNFNGDVSAWDVSSVVKMSSMFSNSNFNGDVSAWDVSSVTMMGYMFIDNDSFNQDLRSWNVANVIDMRSMFDGASNFRQSFDGWTPASGPGAILDATNMFKDTSCPNKGPDGAVSGYSYPQNEDTSLWCDPTNPPVPALGRYEVVRGDGNGAIVDASQTVLSAEVFFEHGEKLLEDMLSLELYGMIGAEPADDDVPLKCEDGPKITAGLTSDVLYDENKASFTLDLSQVDNKVSDGNTIKVCASLVTTPHTDGPQAARLETIFVLTYTYESDEFSFDVSIADPADAAELTKSEAFNVDVDAFVCDTSYQSLSIDDSSTDPVVQARIGQDVRICTTPTQISTAFQYSVTDYKDVNCVGDDGSSNFDITFGENSVNEVGTPIADGTNSFVFLLAENLVTLAGYDETSSKRELSCTGTAVITTTNERGGRRDLEVSFGASSRSVQATEDIQESDFGMLIGIEDSVAAGAAAHILSVATAIGSLVCAFFIM